MPSVASESPSETASESASPSISPAVLANTYVSTEVTGHDLVADTTIRLTFEDGNLSVNAGCNTMFAPYELTDDSLAWTEEPAATMMGCPDDLTAQDQWLAELFTTGVGAAADGADADADVRRRHHRADPRPGGRPPGAVRQDLERGRHHRRRGDVPDPAGRPHAARGRRPERPGPAGHRLQLRSHHRHRRRHLDHLRAPGGHQDTVPGARAHHRAAGARRWWTAAATTSSSTGRC